MSPETGLLRSWPEAGPREVWRRPIGSAFSAVAAAGGFLYTTSSNEEHELALCLDAKTGKEVWSVVLGEQYTEEFGNGPRATPLIDGDRVYFVSSRGKVRALGARDGSDAWEVDLQEEFGSPMPGRGFSSSPLVDGELLILDAGGTEGRAFIALDKKTGKTRWTALDGRPGYSSPIVVTIDGVRQIVFASLSGGVVSLLPDGSTHWQHEWPGGPIAMPVFISPNHIFVSSPQDMGGLLLEIGLRDEIAEVRSVWESRFMKNHFNSSVLHGEHLYGFDNATLRCISTETGETAWAKRGFGKGSLIVADGLLVILSDRGALALAEADPSGYKELGRVQAMEGKAWTNPTLTGGKLYLRDFDEVVAFDLTAEAAPSPGAE